jgi:hypothetical protein
VIKGGSARYWVIVAALATFAVAVRFEAINSGFFADDYAQLGMVSGNYPLPRSKLDLFTFSDGSVTEGEALIRSGFYPWFTNPTLRISMFRPLASGMIWLDYQIFGRKPLGYHYHSVFWWCVLFGVVAWLYRQLLPERDAILALALFATSVAHCVVIAWVANRCAIVCATFALLSVMLYRRRREREDALSPWPVALCFTLSFGFGEYALCALGYVVAYEAILGRGTRSVRLQHLWPVAVPTFAFLAIRGAFHYTPRGSGVYVDPVSDPLAFAVAAMQRVPVLTADMVLDLRGEYWTFGMDPWIYRWLDPSWIPVNSFARLDAWRTAHVAFGVLACVLFGLLCRWVWRWSDNPHLRWLGVGSALSLVPVIASFPSSRLLLLPLVGFCPLLAALFCTGVARVRTLFGSGARARALALSIIATGACAYHLILGTWLTRDQMVGIDQGSHQMRNAVLALEADSRFPSQHVVLLAAAEGNTSMYVPLTRWVYGRSVPVSCFVLSLVPSAYALQRVADNAFTIEYYKPASLLRTAAEQLLRGPQTPLRENQVFDAGLFRVTILSLRNGLPSRLLVQFDWPLEHPALRFMLSTREGIRVFKLPPVGAVVSVPAPAIPDG